MSTHTSDLHDSNLGRTPRSSRVESLDAEPIPSLLRRLADEVSTLFAKELALLKSETTAAIGEVKVGLVSVATGGAVLFIGVLLLLLAAVYGLSEVMPPWQAALIVGGVITVIGMLMLMAGRKKLESDSVRPKHTAASLKKDRDMMKGVTP